MRLAVVLLLIGCASAAPHRRDSPQFRECKEKCEAAGSSDAAVVEDQDSFQCFRRQVAPTVASR